MLFVWTQLIVNNAHLFQIPSLVFYFSFFCPGMLLMPVLCAVCLLLCWSWEVSPAHTPTQPHLGVPSHGGYLGWHVRVSRWQVEQGSEPG